MKGKYIVINDSSMEKIILFAETTRHNELVNKELIISAGFFRLWFQDGGCHVACWGESKSLGIQSRKGQDSLLIRMSMKEEYDETDWWIV